jgi:MFS family permease
VFHVTERGIGLILAYFGAMMIVVQGGLVGRVSKRLGETRVLCGGPLITAAGLFVLSGLATTATMGCAWALLFVASTLIALGHGLTGPNVNALISKCADEGRQGMTFGASQGVASIARAVAPPLGGLFYEIRSALPYWVGSTLMVSMAMLALAIHRAARRMKR